DAGPVQTLPHLLTTPPAGPPLFPYTTLFRSRPFLRPARRDDALDRHAFHHHHAQSDHHGAHEPPVRRHHGDRIVRDDDETRVGRSEEHTSELQSPCNLVCRLLLETKNNGTLR